MHEAGLGEATIRTVTLRPMPLLGPVDPIAPIDRQTISSAKPGMVGAPGLSETAYGLGASLWPFLSACLATGAGPMVVVLSALRRDAARRGAPVAAAPAR